MKNTATPKKVVHTSKALPIVGRAYEVWELPKKSKKVTTNHISNKRARLGSDYQTKTDYINDNGIEFDSKTAQLEKILDTTKKIRLSNKAKNLIRKDRKIEAIYNTQQMKTDISPSKCKERETVKANKNFASLRKSGKITKY